MTTDLASLTLGVVAGMRSQLPNAVLAVRLPRTVREQPARALASPTANVLLPLAAAGELVADKLSVTPARTRPAPLVGRMLAGGLAGYTLAVARDESPLPAALLGAGAALASSYAFERTRAALGRALDLPDLVVALAEDGAAIALALRATRGLVHAA